MKAFWHWLGSHQAAYFFAGWNGSVAVTFLTQGSFWALLFIGIGVWSYWFAQREEQKYMDSYTDIIVRNQPQIAQAIDKLREKMGVEDHQ